MKLVFGILSFALISCAQTSKVESISSKKFEIEKVYQGKSVLWGFDFLSPNELIISHKKKKLVYYNLETKKSKELTTPKYKKGGQGGLLDVLVHKEYVYITYSKELKEDNVVTALARGKWSNGELIELKDIYISNAGGDAGRHFGSRLLIKDEALYMTVGERGERDKAQSLKFDNGSVLRLTLKGEPHPENNVSKDRPAIYSYGHRNPQGITLIGDKIIEAEFGPRGGDEINLIQKGKNYGWPVITYGSEYYGPSIGSEKKAGMEQPLHYWVPSISPSGMAYYNLDKIKIFKDQLFLANLSSAHIRMLSIDKNLKVTKEVELFKDMSERFRMLRASSDGFLYFSTDSGALYRVKKQL